MLSSRTITHFIDFIHLFLLFFLLFVLVIMLGRMPPLKMAVDDWFLKYLFRFMSSAKRFTEPMFLIYNQTWLNDRWLSLNIFKNQAKNSPRKIESDHVFLPFLYYLLLEIIIIIISIVYYVLIDFKFIHFKRVKHAIESVATNVKIDFHAIEYTHTHITNNLIKKCFLHHHLLNVNYSNELILLCLFDLHSTIKSDRRMLEKVDLQDSNIACAIKAIELNKVINRKKKMDEKLSFVYKEISFRFHLITCSSILSTSFIFISTQCTNAYLTYLKIEYNVSMSDFSCRYNICRNTCTSIENEFNRIDK